MAKRLGGGLLGFGVKTAGEFCISYNVRMGETRACARSSHINTDTPPRHADSQIAMQNACDAAVQHAIQQYSMSTVSLSGESREIRARQIQHPKTRARARAEKLTIKLTIKSAKHGDLMEQTREQCLCCGFDLSCVSAKDVD
jgi:hypothetical protein